jgi:hypothetical protein
MMAAVDMGTSLPCVVRWTGRTGLIKVITRTFCGNEIDASEGVMQIHDDAKICAVCKSIMETARQTGRY